MIWLAIVLVAYVLLVLGICAISARPIRLPIFFAPGTLGIPQEDVEFDSSDGIRLRGWWIGKQENASVAILAHGYLINRSELAPLATWLHSKGISSLVFDLRAHGKSGGRRCTFGRDESRDVIAAVRFVRIRLPQARIVVIGSSMGAAAAALALVEEPTLFEALVLDCSYSRLSTACLGWWSFLGGKALQILLSPTVFIGPIVTGVNPFNVDVARALRRAKNVKALLIHGDRGRLAPPSEARRNRDALGGNGKLVWMKGCDHAEGRWTHAEAYLAAIEEFLSENGFMTKSEAGQTSAPPSKKGETPGADEDAIGAVKLEP